MQHVKRCKYEGHHSLGFSTKTRDNHINRIQKPRTRKKAQRTTHLKQLVVDRIEVGVVHALQQEADLGRDRWGEGDHGDGGRVLGFGRGERGEGGERRREDEEEAEKEDED